MNNVKRFFLFTLITASLVAETPQGGSVVVLSHKVGPEINCLENAYYHIFPDLPQLWSAQIVYVNPSYYGVKILYLDSRSRQLQKTVKRLRVSEYEALKQRVDLTPRPSEEDIQKITGTFLLLKQMELFRKIPAGYPVKIFRFQDTPVKGVLNAHEDKGMIISGKNGSVKVPYPIIEKGYWLEYRTRNHGLDKYIYGGALGLGAMSGYLLFRENSRPVRYYKTAVSSVSFLLITELLRQTYLTKIPRKHAFEIIWH
jgi:hypothetical protein